MIIKLLNSIESSIFARYTGLHFLRKYHIFPKKYYSTWLKKSKKILILEMETIKFPNKPAKYLFSFSKNKKYFYLTYKPFLVNI